MKLKIVQLIKESVIELVNYTIPFSQYQYSHII